MTPVVRTPPGAASVIAARVVAVLGPTNTGKTYLAIERMLGHSSGMIGFPLRLLARENYDRIVALKGPKAVALITGEEMIIPAHPRYFVCTVEAMPVDRPVAFLAVDEIQLCADPERGHVFTDRLLHARGLEETMVLGAETIAPLIRRLVPRAEFISRPRFSQLTYAGARKLVRLPPRSAVVAFSVAEVYAMAELIRRQRGGTAVVLGALSPRTRNAQVALYQSGEVDYLVATDAVGMGLNLDVDHVAFAGLAKFDGRVPRRLEAHEIAQIAGRAGRHRSDGTFGTTGELAGFDPEQIEAIENHVFPPLKALRWRNAELRFDSPEVLLRGLDQRPPRPELVRAREGDDHQALAALARDPEVAALARGRAAVEQLWEVCRIPDFRKVLSDAHTRLLGQIYRYLRTGSERLPEDWVAGHVDRLDRFDGDIDALVSRIAHTRTWTYISNRPRWLPDPGHWQERTRAIEDRLSDALHQRLTQRFVDRRSALLSRSLKGGGALLAAVSRDGGVIVEGHGVGDLRGFRFVPDTTACGEDGRALMSAARRALTAEIAERVRQLDSDPGSAFSLGTDGIIRWHGADLARLGPGPEPLSPAVLTLHDELLDPAQRERIAARLGDWLGTAIAGPLAPLRALAAAELAGPARGLAFQLVEALGDLPRPAVAGLVAGLQREDRRALAALGVRVGLGRLFLPALVKPAAVAMRALLYAVSAGLPLPTPVPPPGRVSVAALAGLPAAYYAAIGYPVAGAWAIRSDILDRFENALVSGPPSARLIGVAETELPAILTALGYRWTTGADGGERWQAQPAARPRRPRRGCGPAADSLHPFAKLRELAR
ncbi:MAG: helicase-related protein [Rhodospirillaceae bacterium]